MLMTPGARRFTGAGTDSIFRMAARMPFDESEQLMCSASDSGELTARAPGHTPVMPMPLTGAAATAAVAVPCALLSGRWPSELKFGSCLHSRWLVSACASTSAINGLCAVTVGGLRPEDTTNGRQPP